MKKVILIKDFYGYCPGLKQSLKIADELAVTAEKGHKKIFFDVPLAHNEKVSKNLQESGFRKIKLKEDIKGKGNYFLTSAHGANPQKYRWLKDHDFVITNATCPRVRIVQELAEKDYKAGYQIVIFGKADHDEVKGVNGHTDNSAIVFRGIDDAYGIKLTKKASVLCQTTLPSDDFLESVEIIKKNNPKIKIVVRNTVCPIVENRMKHIIDYLKKEHVGLAVVVGSRTSSNTKLLASRLKRHTATIMVDDEKELQKHLPVFRKIDKILVASGTSAPPEIVEKVAQELRKN